MLKVFGDILRRHPKNSSEDGRPLHPPIGLSEACGRGPWDRPYRGLWSPRTHAISWSFFSPPPCWLTIGDKNTSLIALACLSLATSFLTTSTCSFEGRQGSCLFGVIEGLTFKWWQMKFGSMPGASYALHANTSTFSLRNSTNCSFSCKVSLAPTWKNFSRSSPTITLSRSSHFALSAGLLKGNAGVSDCYKPLSAVAEVSASGQC